MVLLTSTAAPADARPDPAAGRALVVVPNSVTPPSIRMAGLADIAAIARITQEGPELAGIEPEVMSQAMRLLLTLLAFEHGALWVEQAPDGSIVRAVTAVPADQLPPRRAVLRDVANQLGGVATPPPAAVVLGHALHAELKAARAAWVLIEISKASGRRMDDPGLLRAALQWVRAQPDSERAPVMVLADTMPERAAAASLGFVERRTWGYGWPWWLGVVTPAAPTLPV